jgi:tetraacyldisaccharide 4'-kinase
LREPIREVRRADIIVVNRKAEHFTIKAEDAHNYSIFYSQTLLLGFRSLQSPNDSKYLTEIAPGPFFAFCGLGNPQAFLKDLERWHVPVCDYKFFRDHHRYTHSDRDALVSAAKAKSAAGFVTTEKDWMNWRHLEAPPLPVYVAAITLSLRSESEFDACLERKLKAVGAPA